MHRTVVNQPLGIDGRIIAEPELPWHRNNNLFSLYLRTFLNSNWTYRKSFLRFLASDRWKWRWGHTKVGYKRPLKLITISATSENGDSTSLNPETIEEVVTQTERSFKVMMYALMGTERMLEGDQVLGTAKRFCNTPFTLVTDASAINNNVAESLGECGNVYPMLKVAPDLDVLHPQGELATSTTLLDRYGVPFGFCVPVEASDYVEATSTAFLKKARKLGFLAGMYIKKVSNPIRGSHVQRYVERLIALRKHPIFVLDKDQMYENGEICPALDGKLVHITHDGYVTPCIRSTYRSEDFRIGNGSLADVIHRMHKLDGPDKIGVRCVHEDY